MKRKLKARMTEEAVTEEMIAEAAGVSRRTVQNWIAGATDIKIRSALKIRDTFFKEDKMEVLFKDFPDTDAS